MQSLYLPKPDIFSFAECLHFLDRGYDDCLYSVEGDRGISPLRIAGEPVVFQVSEQKDALEIQLLAENVTEQVRETVARYVTDWFDLERNLQPFYNQLEQHPGLSWMPQKFHGLRLMGIPDLFEALCWCVIGQQINLTFAHKLKRQLVETYGASVPYESQRLYLFPDPEILANLTVSDLKELQFSRQKAEYIIGIAKDFLKGNLSKSELTDYQDGQHMLKRLKQIRGVGDWTANYVLMKSLKQMNCITYGDTGLQSAIANLEGLDRKPKREEVVTFFEPFVGWESYLVIYLWRTLS